MPRNGTHGEAAWEMRGQGPELRPCPFCGERPTITKSPFGHIEYIECLNCDLKTSLTPDEWNIRHKQTRESLAYWECDDA